MEQVRDYEGLYEIHVDGTPDGQPGIWSCKRNRYLTPALHDKGYHKVTLSKNGRARHFSIHRLVATHFLNPPQNPDFNQVDHINRDKTDNRIQNLRWVSDQLNKLNKPNIKGYYWDREKKKWRAKIEVNGKQIHLGCFKEEQEAADAYVAALDEHFPGCSQYYLYEVITD